MRSGPEVTLLTWQGINPPDSGLRTLSLPKNSFLGMSDYAGGPIVKSLAASLEIRRETKDFDLIHFSDSTYGAFIKHPRLVLTTWGYFTWKLGPRWYFDRFGFPINIPGTAAYLEFMAMNTLALRAARAIISLLPLKYLPKHNVRENTFYIPPPLTFPETPKVSRPGNNEFDIAGNTVFIFGSRDLSIRGKGAQLAIDAFTKLRMYDGVHGVLVMVGGNKDALRVPSSIKDSVIFTGFLERADYLKLLGPGRCFFALSHGEELDYACIEAMAAGCAVIASDIPAHYMVRDHETGRVVLRNSNSIYSAMRELTDDTRYKLGRNAASEVKQLTSPAEVARKYLAIYQSALRA